MTKMKGITIAWIIGIVGIMVIMPFVPDVSPCLPDQNFLNAWTNYDKATAFLKSQAVVIGNMLTRLFPLGSKGWPFKTSMVPSLPRILYRTRISLSSRR